MLTHAFHKNGFSLSTSGKHFPVKINAKKKTERIIVQSHIVNLHQVTHLLQSFDANGRAIKEDIYGPLQAKGNQHTGTGAK